MKYIIESNEGYWSNDFGWVSDIPSATKYDEDEKEISGLPMGLNVRWVEMPRVLFHIYGYQMGRDTRVCNKCHERIQQKHPIYGYQMRKDRKGHRAFNIKTVYDTGDLWDPETRCEVCKEIIDI